MRGGGVPLAPRDDVQDRHDDRTDHQADDGDHQPDRGDNLTRWPYRPRSHAEGGRRLGAREPVLPLEDRFWIPELPLLLRGYWHQQNVAGRSYYRRRGRSAGLRAAGSHRAAGADGPARG